MIKSSLLNYELPNSSINQEPYENPLDSKLLIAENREIISFKHSSMYLKVSQSLSSLLCSSCCRPYRFLPGKTSGDSW